eukprot:2913867-Ditylum_brightwellii.AAC.1
MRILRDNAWQVWSNHNMGSISCSVEEFNPLYSTKNGPILLEGHPKDGCFDEGFSAPLPSTSDPDIPCDAYPQRISPIRSRQINSTTQLDHNRSLALSSADLSSTADNTQHTKTKVVACKALKNIDECANANSTSSSKNTHNGHGVGIPSRTKTEKKANQVSKKGTALYKSYRECYEGGYVRI